MILQSGLLLPLWYFYAAESIVQFSTAQLVILLQAEFLIHFNNNHYKNF